MLIKQNFARVVNEKIAVNRKALITTSEKQLFKF